MLRTAKANTNLSVNDGDRLNESRVEADILNQLGGGQNQQRMSFKSFREYRSRLKNYSTNLTR